MPVVRNASYYFMEHEYRGQAIIFNHEHFDANLNLNSRPGTNVDCYNLYEVLDDLGFCITPLNNLKYEDMVQHLQQTAEMDHTNSDCLLIVVLSHGDLGKLYAKDTHYKPEKLWYTFTEDKCPTLAGKPKLFFIQACQGGKYDGGITLTNTETDGSATSSYKIVQPDFLIASSTVPGYYSWRNKTDGSWFMQALCEELRTTGKKRDILTLLTFVLRRVAVDFESNCQNLEMNQQKQIPTVSSTLTRLLLFS